ncbi:MAG: type II toxin-antitoxin system Phd/YefM family antitoxin [Gammaproteobacteria bacterium]|nr:MAG: type II toxin-antitoxin system Phd/YefM family antitoxin [Gammaproteobacteria bacterium]
MLTLGAREAKNEFGRMLDAAQSETVLIEKKGRPVAVVLSIKDYQSLEAAQDKLWEMLAKTSEIDGLVSEKESADFLKSLRHVKD